MLTTKTFLKILTYLHVNKKHSKTMYYVLNGYNSYKIFINIYNNANVIISTGDLFMYFSYQ